MSKDDLVAQTIEKIETCFTQINVDWDDIEGVFDNKEILITGEEAKKYIINQAGEETLEIYIYLPNNIIAINVFDHYEINVSIIPKNLKS